MLVAVSEKSLKPGDVASDDGRDPPMPRRVTVKENEFDEYPEKVIARWGSFSFGVAERSRSQPMGPPAPTVLAFL
jgi:hypothetical protein